MKPNGIWTICFNFWWLLGGNSLHGIGQRCCSKHQDVWIFLVDTISTIQQQRGTLPLSWVMRYNGVWTICFSFWWILGRNSLHGIGDFLLVNIFEILVGCELLDCHVSHERDACCMYSECTEWFSKHLHAGTTTVLQYLYMTTIIDEGNLLWSIHSTLL